MNAFLKILGNQESGYTGDRPNQRGKYILIPVNAWKLFPRLSETTLNDFSAITIYFNENEKTVVNYHYNNAKFHPDLGLSRDHNERRIYRNSLIDEHLKLDREVLILFIKLEHLYNSYFALSYNKSDKLYSEIANKYLKNNQFNLFDISTNDLESGWFKNFSFNKVYTKIDYQDKQEALNNAHTLISNTRKQQPGSPNDPAKPLETLIKNQKDFSDYVRHIYDGKCALRKNHLHDRLGLEAAHIQPHSHNGPLLPTNGILLSRDLHHAFENYAFSLDENNRVIISKSVHKDSELRNFVGNKVSPIIHETYKPYDDYVKFHRDAFYLKEK